MMNAKDSPLGGKLSPFQGLWPAIDPSAFVFSGAQIIGDVTIKAAVSVWHNVVIRGDVNYVSIDERSNVQDGTVIHVSTNSYPTIIGKDVLIAHKAMLHGCTLKDRCFVGIGAIVMDNTVIEEDGMLAAGGMLTAGKIIKQGELWAGSPAKFMRKLTQEEIDKNRNMAEHYLKIAKQHRADLLKENRNQSDFYPILTMPNPNRSAD